MALKTYKSKRKLQQTPEPAGGRSNDRLHRFVVQKHEASRLHYDFRLEMDDVLKSWAVPKGPSMNPSIKRLAMEVEDHPYDYRSFEGVIPKGNYGAGTVMVWDEGTYEIAKGSYPNKKAADKELLRQWRSGKIHVSLNGEKLKGEFALVKAAWRGEKSWLLMKLKDNHITTDDILLNDRSATTGRTLDEITGGEQKRRRANVPKKKIERVIKRQKGSAAPGKDKAPEPVRAAGKILRSIRKSKFPNALKPMLATLVDKPVSQEGWLYEIKWDGYRAMAFMNNGEVQLRSRNEKSFDDKFYPVHVALTKWKINAIVDGEVVVLNEKGVSDFGALQNWRSEADGDLYYFVFDILWLNGKDLRNIPLAERKEVLKSLLPQSDVIRLSDAFEVAGADFFAAAKRMGLEGVIAKKSDSIYEDGLRTNHWLKIKANKRQEVVIGGYTHNKDSVKVFSALLVGVYENGKLVYTGKIGTGFSDLKQRELVKLFAPYITEKPPFAGTPDYNKPSRFNPRPAKATVTWLKPKLVCEVSFTEMTADGIMRHPSFEGMRIDKDASDVNADHPADTKVIEREESHSIVVPAVKRERATLLNPKDETQVRAIGDFEIKFNNLSKVYWPDSNITKRDMLNYYYQVAPFLLPYLKDRPQSLNRFPNGITGKSFYQKDITGKIPGWVETHPYRSSDEPEVEKNYLVPKSEADILLMAGMGCIEMNPWSSTILRPDHPDWCIIDLDPDKQSFDKVVQAALITKQVLDEVGVTCFCKTSGSTGLHIYIPLGARYTYEQSKEFARAIVTKVNKETSKFTSIRRAVADREGKMYLDFLQNRPQATLAAAYSVRPKPKAPVSMPLHWDEVKKGLKITDFTIKNAMARIRETGDLFSGVLGKGIAIPDAPHGKGM
jgi:bifunctional non-homologous end joining protein LigD